MKNNIFSRVMVILMVFLMLFSVCGMSLETIADSIETTTGSSGSAEWQLMSEDSGLRLFLNSETTNFYVEDSISGKRFYAFKEDVSGDAVATPVHQVEMQSTLVFTLWDPVKKTETRKNSKGGSVNGKNFKIRKQDNGFFVDYNLKSSGVSATLSVVLKDGKLNCTVPSGSVKENDPSKCQILKIDVLPYMISGLADTEGQIILPDGCGEILDFSTVRSSAKVYQKPIYGRNLSMNLSVEEKKGYDITTPYLALVSEDVGVLAVPTAAAAVGYVNASPAGKQSSYANAYYSFQYRASDIAIIGDRSTKASQNTVVIDENAYDGDITICFSFIFSGAKIGDLARLYGEYLAPASKTGVKAKQTAVFDIYGFVNEKKNFLGFPYTSVSVLSDGKDIVALAQDKSFDNIAINLKNFTKQQQQYSLNTNLKPISKIISSSELKQLRQSEAAIYANADMLTFKKNTLRTNGFWSASKTLYGAPVNLYEFRESTHQINKDIRKSYLLKHNLLEETAKKLASSAKKQSLDGISSSQLAAMSYHDYDNGGTLVDTHKAQERACAIISDSSSLILSNPADYAIKYCSMLTDIPTSSSHNDLCSGSYPFIQMALGDSIPYTVEAVNLNRSPETAFLEAVASGSLLHYDLVLTDAKPLIGSDLNYLYSADYSDLQEQIKQQYTSWCEIREAADGSALCEYKTTDNGSISVFANGTELTVNFADKTYTISN